MHSKQMKNGKWWVLGYSDAGPLGPYNTKADAEESRRRLERTLKYMDEPGFVTSENPRQKKGRVVK